MKENAYQSILDIMAGISVNNNSPCICVGKVISDLPNLQIQYNGIILDKNDLWINDYLLTNHTRTHKGHIVSATQNRGGYALFESHNHDINNPFTDTETTIDSDLKAGFYVALMPMQNEDGTKQKYIVLCHIKQGWEL